MTKLLQCLRDELVRRDYAATTIRSYVQIVDAFRQHTGARLGRITPWESRLSGRVGGLTSCAGKLEVQVREPQTCHRITVQQIHRWCDGVAVSLDETLKKRKLKQLLA